MNKRVQELSFLNAGVTIEVTDGRTGKSKKFKNDGGVSSYVDYLRGRKHALCETIQCEGGQKGITVEVSMQWNDSYNESVLCYTNNIPQKDGGTHLSGFKTALTR